MLKRFTIALAVLLVVAQAGSVLSSPVASTLKSSNAIGLQPEPYLAEASKWATTFLTRAHYKKTRLNDELSEQIFDRYLGSLDPNRVFFLASDIRSFDLYRKTLDDALLKQDLKPAFEIFNIYTLRVAERISEANRLLETDFDFGINESLELDRSEADWARDRSDLDEIWRKRVKNDVLRLRLTDKEGEAIKETLAKRYNNLERRISELDAEDVFQYYMNSFAASIEPHTGYLAPRTSENFQIAMRLSLEGIGAVLQREDEYTTIRKIVRGGPAYRDGQLKAGDRILAVGQGSGEPSVDVIGWRLDDVVDLIRGEAGSKVRLGILPADAGLDGQARTITLIRDKVKLEEQAAKKSVYEYQVDGQPLTIGVIDLPAFYLDFAARARREPDYRSSTRDVRNLLTELKQAKVDGIIVDLRNNGGGSLAEATELTGLFIDSGPVVQVKNANGRIDIETDPNLGIEWPGPLAVLVNRNSASASEIFAAAIQDYGRGVIIGEPTFGKGTVQNLISLDRYGRGDDPRYGQLKLTIAQFFRVNGGSTQNRGVIPDIKFPTMKRGEEHGESALDNALPWTSIKPAHYKIFGDLSDLLPIIDQRSSERLENDTEFRFLMEDIRRFTEHRNDTTVVLLESKRREEMAIEKEQREARKAARKAFTKKGSEHPVIRIDTDDDLELITAESDPEDGEDGADSDDRDIQSDVLLDEAVRIVGDIITLAPTQRTALLDRVKDETIN